MAVELAVLIGALAILALVAAYTLATGVPPMPTSPRVRTVMLAAVPAGFDGVIYDAGSGIGTLAVALARRHPLCRVVGVEISPLPWVVAWARGRLQRLGNLQFRRADFRRVPMGDAGLVVCYLGGTAMAALKAKIEAEATPGCLVVSNTFAVPGWTTERIETVPDLYATKVYVYRVPAARMPA